MQSAMFTYTWDLRDEGIDVVMGRLHNWGVDALSLASSYHAGYRVHPHSPRRKMYMIEDGMVYFHPRDKYFQGTHLKPKVAEIAKDQDWFAATGERLDRFGLKLIAWTVCLHNTRLGRLHPDATVQNVFGDSYPHALCPANESVRLYVRGLCRNLASEYPLYALQIEATAYQGAYHEHHHAGYATVLEPVDSWLMSLCFCQSCRKLGAARGLDVEGAAAAVRDHLSAFFATAPVRPATVVKTKEEMLARVPALAGLEAMRRDAEISLYKEISRDVRAIRDIKIFALRGYDAALNDVVDAFNRHVYGVRPNEAEDRVRAFRAQVDPKGGITSPIRMGFNAVHDAADLADIITACGKGGANWVEFYNYSEAPMTVLEWTGPALRDSKLRLGN